MDWLKNLYSTAKEAITNVFNRPSSNSASVLGASSQPSLSQVVANANASGTGGMSVPPQQVNASFVPSFSTPLGAGARTSDGRIVIPTEYGGAADVTNQLNAMNRGVPTNTQATQQVLNANQAYSDNRASYNNSLNPMQQAAATRTAGFVDPVSGQYVAQTGYSGLAGQSASNFSPSYFGGIANPAAVSGSAGQAGGSAFTGLLTASGGLSTPAIPSSGQSEEERLRQIEENRRRSTGNPFNQSTFTPPVLNPALAALLNVEKPMEVPIPQASFQADRLAQQETQKNAAVIKSSGDLASANSKVASDFQANKAKVDSTNPTPTNPVVADSAQTAVIESSSDPFGVKALIDEYKAQNTNLATLERERLDLQKSIQALNDTYTPIIDEIKSNPNLPKSLAARRINETQKQQKEALTGFINQLALKEDAIKNANESVNRALNIAQFAQSSAKDEQDARRAELKLFIDTGAIGAMSDAELADWAKKSGFTTESLKAIRASAKDPSLKTELVGSSTTGYSLVTYGKDGVTKSEQVVAPAPESASTAEPKQYQFTAANFANRVEQSNANLAGVENTVIGYNPTKFATYTAASNFNVLNPKIPAEIQQYLQASKNFINAVLRRESGAVISDSEFANAKQQYLPIPGDTPQVTAQKQANRAVVERNLIREAGGAYAPTSLASPTGGADLSDLNFKF